MDMDGFGLIVAFCVIAGLIHGILKSHNKRQNKPILNDNEEINDDLTEDSEADGLMLFDDVMFPPELEDIED